MMKDRPRIGIINAHWLVHSSIGYMASCLEKAGYSVDVFLYCSDESLSGDLLPKTAHVRVHRIGNGAAKPDGSNDRGRHRPAKDFRRLAKTMVPARARAWLYKVKERLLMNCLPTAGVIPGDLVRKVVDACAKDSYVALIGVEKGGLGVAGAVARQTGAPLTYYSLELLPRDHPWVRRDVLLKRLTRIEELYHRRCALTIVQDEHRAQALLACNRVSSPMRVAYLPVSLSGSPNHEPSHWLQDELGLAADKVVILSYGIILKIRRSIDLAKVAQSFPDSWRLVFHGFGSTEIIDEIRGVDLLQRVRISQRLVPASQREMIVRSAHIGLAIYSGHDLNDTFTGRSSEKIAIYLKCGLPVISFRHRSYEHIEAERAGVLVESIEEIPAAVEEILRHYDFYVENAYRCFRRYYCFETNFDDVLEALQEISRRRHD
jgi:hypothetical protein